MHWTLKWTRRQRSRRQRRLQYCSVDYNDLRQLGTYLPMRLDRLVDKTLHYNCWVGVCSYSHELSILPFIVATKVALAVESWKLLFGLKLPWQVQRLQVPDRWITDTYTSSIDVVILVESVWISQSFSNIRNLIQEKIARWPMIQERLVISVGCSSMQVSDSAECHCWSFGRDSNSL